MQETSKPSVEPVVPSGAIEAIVRTCFPAEAQFGPLEARNSLLHIYEELRELYLIGIDSGINKPHDAVRLLLDSATGSSETSPSAPASDEVVSPISMLAVLDERSEPLLISWCGPIDSSVSKNGQQACSSTPGVQNYLEIGICPSTEPGKAEGISILYNVEPGQPSGMVVGTC